MNATLPRIALVGTGKMVGAILEGLLQPDVSLEALRATTQSGSSASLLVERGVEAKSVEEDAGANRWAVEDADIVLLGVKPYAIVDVAAEVASALKPGAVVVSVAAGITTASIEAVVTQPVVRAMPNTPSQIRQGVTGIAGGSRASEHNIELVDALFSLVGEVVVVDEDRINDLSALSGSGPAYLFYIAEKLIDVARERGFSDEQAQTMVTGTLLGAAQLLDQSEHSAEQLRHAVTSPGGTTQQAISVLDAHDMGSIWAEAIARAVARAEEMATAK
ncbi:pyrroline-5-carboxylate reductase [Pontimonas sp.]|jgi:pyrroline-5-carboxylate reductase|uniref:pyrroline-5-carboxylate reductase n=1 Tax=Pontimonas sp. TaxID=2304492 RepID=UPI00286FD2BB|nr:pyrroline-5-carboxylate reductase [Pontimonas sp.]MDR9396174.1 pyrroline-5-carboxylate reductase [Pontimonas sp.]